MKKVYVSGVGIISALGVGINEHTRKLFSKETGISPVSILPTKHKDFHVGEIRKTTQELAESHQWEEFNDVSRNIVLGAYALSEAIESAKLSTEQLKDTGFINATTVGGMDKTEVIHGHLLAHENVDLSTYLHHDCGDSGNALGNHFGINGFRSTISTACSSSTNSIMQGARMIKLGMADRMIVGGVDALSLFTFNGFRSLQILDPEWCRPFDKNRKGLNLGEGAAYLVLESEESLKKRNGKAIVEISGYGNANDAFHQTASSAEGNGAFMAMNMAIESSGLETTQIDYVNAHGTATPINDSSEGNALKRIFGTEIPPYSSTKSYTGHTLAAAGSIEAIFSIIAIQNQKVCPNLNFTDPIDDLKPPVLEATELPIRHVLSNSFGFGGNCSSVIISAI